MALAIIEEEDIPFDGAFWADEAGRFSDSSLDDVDGDLAYSLVDDSYAPRGLNDNILRPSPLVVSLRSMVMRLHESSGWVASFRGVLVFSMIWLFHLLVKIVYNIVTRTTVSEGKWTYSPSLDSDLSTGFPALGLSLAFVQLNAHWVHTIITAPAPFDAYSIMHRVGSLRSIRLLFMGGWTIPHLLLEAFRSFCKRLPPFTETFHATAMPVALQWFASNVASWIDGRTRHALGVVQIDSVVEPGRARRAVIALAVSYGTYLVLVVPTQIVLFRIQASMLPEHDKSIVPFRRTFRRFVEPKCIGGTGYLSMGDAWRSFSRRSWRRLATLYTKVSIINAAIYFLLPIAVRVVLMLLPHKGTGHTTEKL
ncbi:hypothetical protein ColTof4_08740 [Colletotrichum tofieldiae]|nr:hypothetical protein ColTof3_04055 [Colletotrichum tofieldiae]GKT76317.1 hypothetical protein ColTof4_08740 [Colletotrichum tofieldiae]